MSPEFKRSDHSKQTDSKFLFKNQKDKHKVHDGDSISEKAEEDEDDEFKEFAKDQNELELEISESIEETESKSPEIKLQDLKNTINNYFIKSNELLQRK